MKQNGRRRIQKENAEERNEMNLNPKQLLSLITLLTLMAYTSMPRRAEAAEPHVVTLSDMQRTLTSSQNERAKNLQDIERVLSLPAAQDALANSHVSVSQVKVAVSNLSDREVARLADRARAAEKDVQGGLIVGLLALIGLVVVILIVVNAVN